MRVYPDYDSWANENRLLKERETKMTNKQLKEMCDTLITIGKEARKSTKYVQNQLFNVFSPSVMSVFGSMNDDQKNLLYILVGNALDERDNSSVFYQTQYSIKKVIFNGPATIVIWGDGSKTVVKLMEGDDYDAEKAIMMCVMEKMLGSKGDVKRFFKKWIPEVDLIDLNETLSGISSKLSESISAIAKGISKALALPDDYGCDFVNSLVDKETKEEKSNDIEGV